MERTMLTLTNETQQTAEPLRPVVRWRRPGDESGAMVIDEVNAAGRTVRRGTMLSCLAEGDEPASDELLLARRRDADEAAATLPRD